MAHAIRGSLAFRAFRAFRQWGLKTMLARVYVLAIDWWFDLRYRTETHRLLELAELAVQSRNKEHANGYMGTRIVPLRRLLRRLAHVLPRNRVLLDLGCGKGRVLMVASEFGFRRAKGVDFANDLCRVARKNCATFKRAAASATDFEIIEADAADYEIKPDENVFFLYNPFDEVVLKRVLSNIAKSVEAAPRDVVLIYCNPQLSRVVEQQGRFAKLSDISFWGYRFAVYSKVSLTILQFLFGDFAEGAGLLTDAGQIL
jgi:SAM-dependent methyltransferase